jgi:hypothetical protein
MVPYISTFVVNEPKTYLALKNLIFPGYRKNEPKPMRFSIFFSKFQKN